MTSNNDIAIAALRIHRAQLDAERTGITNTPALKGHWYGRKKQLNNSSGWAKAVLPALAPAMSWISGEKLPVSVMLLSGQSMPVKKIFAPRA